MATDTILELDGVVSGYGRTTILNGTTFAIRRGAITTIVGPNGAGKSTVFKTVFGLLPSREGTIRFDGADITNRPIDRLLAAGICYVPQGRNIFPQLSVETNLELGGFTIAQRELKARVNAAMDRFQVLRRKAGSQASTLSGGEQKLLEIARGLLLNPKLILIDEPSIGLSPLLVEETFSILRGLRDAGTTILMVEQNARSALQISDDGIVLEQGRTRLAAPANAILNDPHIGELFLGGGMEDGAAEAVKATRESRDHDHA